MHIKYGEADKGSNIGARVIGDTTPIHCVGESLVALCSLAAGKPQIACIPCQLIMIATGLPRI
jgi:hypothetical protein